MSIRYGSRSRPGTMVSTWLNGLVSGTADLGAAYWAGGYSYTNAIQKTVFTTDATATIGTTLTVATAFSSGCANSGTAAYWGGGANETPSWNLFDAIDKLLFSNDSLAAITPTLSAATYILGALANSGTAGYWAGGNPGSYTDTINKTAFSNDATAAITPTLSAASSYLRGAANVGTAGYWAGMYTGSNTDTINKTAFADDSTAAITPTLSADRRYVAAAALSGTAGYWAGGNESSGNVGTIDKTAFATDSTSAITPTVTSSIYDQQGAANSAGL